MATACGCFCVIKSMLIRMAVAVVTEDRSHDLRWSREDRDIEQPRWRVQVGSSMPHGAAALSIQVTYIGQSLRNLLTTNKTFVKMGVTDL